MVFMKKGSMILGCLLLAGCQPKTPIATLAQPLPYQDKMQTLCDLYRTDVYNFAAKAAKTTSNEQFADSIKVMEDAHKIMGMLNCKKWDPS
jgi:hypothetical protein